MYIKFYHIYISAFDLEVEMREILKCNLYFPGVKYDRGVEDN